MKRELRLVKGGEDLGSERDPLAAEAEELVRGAAGQGALEAVDHEALLALALGDEAASFAPAECEAAAALRDALAGAGEHPLAELAGALRALHAPAALAPRTHAALLERALSRHAAAAVEAEGEPQPRSDGHGASAASALARAAEGEPVPPAGRARTSPKRRAWPFVALGTALAAAAALVLVLTSGAFDRERRTGTPTAAAFIQARSTQALFDPAQPFPARGGESERMDRIARARAADLRANRYASWGVR
ncbi:MAG: hypothetical protein IT373_19175 [Polyangiaceae bacterium]|nr:hypothetical protein [Polyangiaceae bacterium]